MFLQTCPPAVDDRLHNHDWRCTFATLFIFAEGWSELLDVISQHAEEDLVVRGQPERTREVLTTGEKPGSLQVSSDRFEAAEVD